MTRKQQWVLTFSYFLTLSLTYLSWFSPAPGIEPNVQGTIFFQYPGGVLLVFFTLVGIWMGKGNVILSMIGLGGTVLLEVVVWQTWYIDSAYIALTGSDSGYHLSYSYNFFVSLSYTLPTFYLSLLLSLFTLILAIVFCCQIISPKALNH